MSLARTIFLVKASVVQKSLSHVLLVQHLIQFGTTCLADMSSKMSLPTKEQALPGRSEPQAVTNKHAVNSNPIVPPFPDDMKFAMFGMGCFWGAERKFWQQKGVYSTHVGYSAGITKNPTYQEVCSGKSGHSEVVRVIFDPAKVSYSDLLVLFWESHNPTQGMRQGNDQGTQYRSGIYYHDPEQKSLAEESKAAYQAELTKKKLGTITTEILAATEFYYADDHHQQYLHKNPGGYCGLGGTGVTCPVGLGNKKASGSNVQEKSEL